MKVIVSEFAGGQFTYTPRDEVKQVRVVLEYEDSEGMVDQLQTIELDAKALRINRVVVLVD